ncbi:hypothetical protein [Pseudarthrobacter sp. Y6]|uniref:hypothetical protein n=1 Tax=Pseudarthrobacter sp. Y6 TaxID=3418422 RepID=UPI003CF593D2
MTAGFTKYTLYLVDDCSRDPAVVVLLWRAGPPDSAPCTATSMGSAEDHPDEPLEGPGASRSPASIAVGFEVDCGEPVAAAAEAALAGLRVGKGVAEDTSDVIDVLHRPWR